MKFIYRVLFILLFLLSYQAQAQVSINENGNPPNPKAMLDVSSSSNNKGVLIPRLTQTEIAAMTDLPTGLLTFNSTANDFFFFNGTAWKKVGLGKTGGPFDDSTYFFNSADTTKKFRFVLSGITTGNTRVYEVPDANTTLVGTNATQSLTNKTITDQSNTIRATQLATATMGSDVSIANATPPSIGQRLTATSSTEASWQNTKVWIIQDIKPRGTPGGTAVSGFNNTRDLNTITYSGGSEVTLIGNTISITEGIYKIRATVPGFNSGFLQGRLFDVTAGVVSFFGTNSNSGNATTPIMGRSEIEGVVTIPVGQTKVFRIEQYFSTGRPTDGCGIAVSPVGGQEVYTSITIEKL